MLLLDLDLDETHPRLQTLVNLIGKMTFGKTLAVVTRDW